MSHLINKNMPFSTFYSTKYLCILKIICAEAVTVLIPKEGTVYRIHASQGSGKDRNHPSVSFCFCFFEIRSQSVTQTGIQWHNLCSLLPRPPGFKQSSHLNFWSHWITGVCHHTRLIFVFLVKTGFRLY